MSNFKDIIGHEQIKEHLQNAIRLDKVSHAYILHGEAGAGKKTLAKTFAMSLQCEKKDIEPCLECHSCKQFVNNNQPDVIWVTHDKPKSIGVEDIRNKLNGDIMVKPYSSAYKIYIIDESEKLTVQAQNALLKTIEEPPAYAVIILLTTNTSLFLPTILSRCITLNLKPIKDALIRNYLMEHIQVPDYQAAISVAFAQGNVGKAIKLATSDDFNQIKEDALKIVKNVDELETYELIDSIKKINDYKSEIEDYLDIIMIWYRDVLLFKATSDANTLLFREDINYIRKSANHSSYEGIDVIIGAIEQAKTRLRANVNFDLVMELLLFTMKEN